MQVGTQHGMQTLDQALKDLVNRAHHARRGVEAHHEPRLFEGSAGRARATARVARAPEPEARESLPERARDVRQGGVNHARGDSTQLAMILRVHDRMSALPPSFASDCSARSASESARRPRPQRIRNDRAVDDSSPHGRAPAWIRTRLAAARRLITGASARTTRHSGRHGQISLLSTSQTARSSSLRAARFRVTVYLLFADRQGKVVESRERSVHEPGRLLCLRFAQEYESDALGFRRGSKGRGAPQGEPGLDRADESSSNGRSSRTGLRPIRSRTSSRRNWRS